jgi:hypothetical protein
MHRQSTKHLNFMSTNAVEKVSFSQKVTVFLEQWYVLIVQKFS